MNKVAMKLERNEEIKINAQPAQIIDLEEKRNEKIQIQVNALENLSVLKALVAGYEVEMKVLAETVTAEQLAAVTPLTAEEQINEDLRRLHTLIEALEYIVCEKVGFSLSKALEILKAFGGEEMATVIEYLENSDYPTFKTMMEVVK